MNASIAISSSTRDTQWKATPQSTSFARGFLVEMHDDDLDESLAK
ncbi:MAG: hypothetical protein VYE04_01030 [Pseudomonadota bacterium]|nr:hypothetical protein [Pseudomonadota bacterium]